MESAAVPSRRRRGIVLGAVVVLGLAVIAAVVLIPSPEKRPPVPAAVTFPPPTASPSPLPVTTGSTPGPQTPGSADTVPLVRPEFQYIGRAPWQLRPSRDPAEFIQGYASAPSYLPGDTIELAVDTNAREYAVRFYRVSGRAPVDSPFEEMGSVARQPGRRQSGVIVDHATAMVSVRWSFTTEFKLPATWPSGIYLARLESMAGASSYVPFVVRSTRPSTYLVVSSALNWQAYNDWGGSSLYGTRVGQPLPGVNRAFAVSFDRPYSYDGGAGQLFFLVLPLVSWIERQGVDVTYTTDYDLSVNPSGQPLPKAVIFNGHDEYWGLPLRRWLEQHVLDEGNMGLGVFAADTGYWPVTLSDWSRLGPRVETCYKGGPVPASAYRAQGSAAPSTPAASEAPEPTGPGVTPEPTAAPGETPISPGGGEEEKGGAVASFPPNGPYVGAYPVQTLFGVSYQHVTTAMAAYTLANPFPLPQLLEATGLSGGDSLGFIAGGEVDGVIPDAEHWGPLMGRYDDVVVGAYGIPSRHSMTSTAQGVVRRLPTGGRVFASGTFYWGWGLDPSFAVRDRVNPALGQLTLNLLRFLAGG